MPEYRSPGVYVEEIDSGSSPIAGVSTSIAGFIGQVNATLDIGGNATPIAMPEIPGKFEVNADGTPKLDTDGNKVPAHYALVSPATTELVTSWTQFKTKFGDFQLHNKMLAHAVYGFFNNGGSRCWVVRLEDAADVTAVTAALEKFQPIDEVTMVSVPGALNVNIQGALIDHCEKMGDRFAILDGQRIQTLTPAAITGGVRNSKYAAIYYPWVKVYDPVSGQDDILPPSGYLAGIYARSDSLRGVHKAPANEVIRGASEVEVRLSKADQDGLNPDGINIIRQFNGNVMVWGARTLGGDANGEWKYINVRRLFLYLRESIDEGTQWVVFEPNTPELWAKITRNITAFLTNTWRSGALFGNTAAEAFYVKCDAETNPPEVRDLGQVITEIGVAPAKPAEFVIFHIKQWAGAGG